MTPGACPKTSNGAVWANLHFCQRTVKFCSDAGADILGVDLGKRLMRNRKPVNVKAFAMAHNFVMFSASLYMVIETVRQVRMHLSPS